MLIIQVTEHRLSDNSRVHDVVFGDVLLPAITQDDANRLAERIKEAILAHTNEDVIIS
jgi:hypothetical protein